MRPPTRESAGRRVLVVDDQPFVCRVIGRLLRRAGYEAWTAGGGTEALSLLEGQEFDLLLTDISMPGMDGFELVARAREMRPDLPVLYMSGHFSAGLDPEPVGEPLLEKPFGSSQLYRALGEILGWGGPPMDASPPHMPPLPPPAEEE